MVISLPFLLAVLLLSLLSFLDNAYAQTTFGGDWVMFRRDSVHTGYNSEEASLRPPLSPVWTFQTDSVIYSSPAVVNGIVYFESLNGTLYALDANTGNARWQRSTQGPSDASPAVVGGTVYSGSPCSNCTLDAFDATTGVIKWSVPFFKGVRNVNPVDNVLYFGSDDWYVRAADASSGAVLWATKLGDGITGTPAVAGGRVFVGNWTLDGSIYALDATTGAILWKFPKFGGLGVVHSSPSVIVGTVYVGSGGNNIYALDAATGTVKWQFCCAEDSVWGSPAVANGVAYIQALAGKIYALDAETGQLLWTFQTGALPSSSMSSPAVANGVVYVGSSDDFLYALDAVTGALLWRYQTGGDVISSPAVANGMVYVGSVDGRLYAFGPADSIAPTTSITITPQANANGWNNADVIVTLQSTDDVSGSGVKEIHYILDTNSEVMVPGASVTVNMLTEGIHTLKYWAVDNAGNKEITKTITVKIDKTSPVATINVFPSTWPFKQTQIFFVRITGNADDGLSGIDLVAFKVKDEYGTSEPTINPVIGNGSSYVSWDFTVQLDASVNGQDRDGRLYTIEATTKDLADNVSTITTTTTVLHHPSQ